MIFPEKNMILVGIYNQQFQGISISMVFDFQGYEKRCRILKITGKPASRKKLKRRSLDLILRPCGLQSFGRIRTILKKVSPISKKNWN